jgi:predicted O-methyltransferase YrrM
MNGEFKVSEEIKRLYPIVVKNNHTFGDAWVATKYCGLQEIPSQISGEWQHGHIIPERNMHPEFVIGSDGLSRLRKNANYLVSRQDQVNYLKSENYTRVYAIGLPMIYVEKPNVSRIKDSLLIMPMHTLEETTENFDEEAYLRYIDSISDKFSYILCCLHKACFTKKYWIDLFEKRNIEVIQSADVEDANSLDRLAYLFSRFEFVTSNEFGSHLAYASFFGAKPSIAGPRASWKKDDYKQLTFYKNAPELLDILQDWREKDFIKECYPFLFCEPYLAKTQQEWANFQLGLKHKQNAPELIKLFGWDVSNQKSSFLSQIRMLTSPKNFLKRFKFVYNIRTKLVHAKLKNEFKIQTHLTDEEKLNLYFYAKKLNQNANALEIGSYLGASSCMIAAALPQGGRLFCIDTWGNHAMIYNEEDRNNPKYAEQDTFLDFNNNTKKYRDKIVKLRGWSHDMASSKELENKKISLLFIDGDHEYEGVKKDWDLFSRFLEPGSYVAFHDTGWAEGVKRVILQDVSRVAQLEVHLANMQIFRILRQID